MAKTKLKARFWGPSSRAATKTMNAKIRFHRLNYGGRKVEACIDLGYSNRARVLPKSFGCGYGKTPRKALSAAFRALAGSKGKGNVAYSIKDRSSAFAGYSKSARKARRTRRAGKRSGR